MVTRKKILAYMDDIPESERKTLHGIIFVAAGDFSKRTRAGLRAKSRDFGIAECHMWGKAELEDTLFQPKNDHLLFAILESL